ncbi:ribonuclease R family protein [Rubellicoccus peritrichatus]|uniref:Ribonuclease R n=1 Tax=Rubellicoccus peritrichatus TaxID=3080537 RepID=A0AAQ3LCS8_9BACT|nr:RNB domain-containing ribonuclease [Puniceicoccus sp. CR14]WOO43106.1 RNB domain-containing ribonuclease [Puniceicoccus sp. CR14]
MPLDQRILEHLRHPDYVPQTAEELDKALELTKAERRSYKRMLHKLLDEGIIAKVKRDKFVLPKDADLVSGEIRFRQSGSAVLVPDQPDGETLQILAEDTGVALHGDKVLVRLQEEPKWRMRKRERRGQAKEPMARVLRILKRKNTTVIGTLKRSRLFHFVIPDDPRINQDILVPPPEDCELTPKPAVEDKVVVRLHEWKQRHMNPEGEISEILGKAHEPFAEFKALLHKFHLDTDFPDAVMREVESIGDKVTNKDIGNRRDMRDIFTLTIDPDDAKDFDDALSIESLPNGGTRVGVHIADVSHYVKSGTELDREARNRGNSTYLVGCVIPMLPHALSNGICSLVEAEGRLTKTVFLDFDSEQHHIDTHFANTVICSNKRLTYKQAFACMTKDDLDAIRGTPMPPSHQTGSTGRPLSQVDDKELTKIRDTIKHFWKIASLLRKKRYKAGSLELDMPEVKIYVDEKGYADRMETTEHDESHQLIEEFMLAANEAVARAYFEQGMPTLSRVHDEPDPEKLLELRDQMTLAGIAIGDLTNRKEVMRMLKKIKPHPQAYTLKLSFLRSMKQACYRPAYDGHYGLAKQFYLHYTSPIRRYSDLVVHRQFDWYACKKKLKTAPRRSPKPYTPGDLEGIGQHLSITERNSQEAERESVKIKLLEFFDREVKKEKKSIFDAVILDVKNHGLFVELTESMAFGLVHISTLQDDLYRISDDGTSLVGRRQRKRYYLGQTVQVVTERVDRFKRQIDFRIIGDKTPPKEERSFAGAVQKTQYKRQSKRKKAQAELERLRAKPPKKTHRKGKSGNPSKRRRKK